MHIVGAIFRAKISRIGGLQSLFAGALLIAGNSLNISMTRAEGLPVSRTIITSAAIKSPQIAIGFDDGPSEFTSQVLGILRAYNAHATFFAVGIHVFRFASVLRQVLADGNEIGNHTYTHANLRALFDSGIASQLTSTQGAIRSATGFTPRWFRPPYGSVDGRVAGIAAAIGLHTTTWSVDPRDWSRPGVGAIEARVLAGVRPGSIIVMHDGGGYRGETVAALPTILSTLRARGYRMVTMSELFGMSGTGLCHPNETAVEFSRAGIAAHPHNAIYGAWGARFCDGDNFGPATSAEYSPGKDVVAQDFARTGHRMVWNQRTNTVHVQVVWSWAVAAFNARGIQPHWGLTVTRAWFEQFFKGYNWGAALTPPSVQSGITVQHFERATAVVRQGKVDWVGRR